MNPRHKKQPPTCHPCASIKSQTRGLACEQAFGRVGNWEEGKAKRPVDKHLGSTFHCTCCASDPDASSYWREH